MLSCTMSVSLQIERNKEFKTARAIVQEARLEPGRTLTLRSVKLTLGDLIPAACVGREIWTRPR